MHIPKKKSVFLLFLFSFITAHIYSYVWYIKRSNELNNLQTQSKLKEGIAFLSLIIYLLLILTAIGMSLTAKITGQDLASQQLSNIAEIPITFLVLYVILAILAITLFILVLFMSFRTRKILNESLASKGSKIKTSWFLTLIFNFYYLQYEINRIIDDREEHRRTGPWVVLLLAVLIPLVAYLILFFFFKSLFQSISL